MYQCIICLGSNFKSEEYFPKAYKMLTEIFPDIQFASLLYTKPYEFSNPAFFANQVAAFSTWMNEVQLHQSLKEIEKACGRMPEDKANEVVRIDMDLIQFEDKIKKPEDFKRYYIQKGINELLAKVECLIHK